MSLGTLLAAIAALPKIMSFMTNMLAFLEQQFGPNWPEIAAQLDEVGKKLSTAKNAEERVDCARELQRLIGKY